MYGKRLCKSSTDRAICGVCGGIAQYFGIDSIIIRLLMVLFMLAFGSGLLFYIVAAIVMPSEEQVMREQADFERYSQNRYSQGGYYGNYNGPSAGAQYGSGQYGGAQTRSYEEKAASAQDAEFTAAPEDAPESAAEGAAEAGAEGSAAGGQTAENGAQGAENAAGDANADAGAGASENGGNSAGEGPQYRSNFEAYQARQQAEEQARRQADSRSYGSYSSYQNGQQGADQGYRPQARNNGYKIIGAVLLLIGVSMVLRYFIPRIPMVLVWAALAIIVGLVLLLRKK